MGGRPNKKPTNGAPPTIGTPIIPVDGVEPTPTNPDTKRIPPIIDTPTIPVDGVVPTPIYPDPKQTPEPLFSSFPELEGREYFSQAELDEAEARVLAARKAEKDAKLKEMEEDSQKLVSSALKGGEAITDKVDIAKVSTDPNQVIDPTTGQAGDITGAVAGVATPAGAVQTPNPIQTATVGTAKSTPAVTNALSGFVGEEGGLDANALMTAIQQDPSTLAQLGLNVDQISQITQVLKPDEMVVQDEELIGGSAVDLAKVEATAQATAAQADPSNQATVKGQLDLLYQDFEASDPPPWAAGAMRSASAAMAARGLGASSMAGQAIVQAAMESALPIAMADAKTFAQFEGMNLSNRQQAAMFSAQQRADFLKLDFSQEFQSRVANASRIADVANMNFTAEQQIALENARMAQTADLANLDARNAKIMADAAAMTQIDSINLSNRQQAVVENAKSFLQMDMANLSNRQQAAMFTAQSIQQAILSDTAAENASAQFNAASENQTNQFMADMTVQVAEFNTAQANAMEQFNVSEENGISQFNAAQRAAREQFNAQNSLIIAQANTKWRQDVATIDTAAQNAANMEDARTANAFTSKTLDELWQRERDLMDYAFKASENMQSRALELVLADKQSAEMNKARKAEEQAALGSIFTQLLFGGLF